MKVFIAEVMPVLGDGNCGYRSLAVLDGGDSDDYEAMRMEVVTEIITRPQLYEPLFHGTRLEEIIQQINFYQSPCPQHYYMEMPLAGLVYATIKQVALVCLSWVNPHLCLPLYTAPGTQLTDLPLHGISNAGSANHFVPVSKIMFITFVSILYHFSSSAY